jgi:ubiquinone/menaquinone biosynthesis C-methylase UbiE
LYPSTKFALTINTKPCFCRIEAPEPKSMKQLNYIILILLLLSYACTGTSRQQNARAVSKGSSVVDSVYFYQPPTRDGTGKIYMEREIARVMGHQATGWLERPNRYREERADLLLQSLQLKPTDVVADIGAGSGYFTFRISPKVPQGQVLAVDVQEEMIVMLKQKREERNTLNVTPILATPRNPNLPPGSIDIALIVDAYHEFSFPKEMMEHIVTALKPDGRVVLVEYRGEDPGIAIKPLHKMTEQQAVYEMNAAGLRLAENKKVLPQQHFMVFVKK